MKHLMGWFDLLKSKFGPYEEPNDMNLTKSSETQNQYMVTKDRFLIQVYK